MSAEDKRLVPSVSDKRTDEEWSADVRARIASAAEPIGEIPPPRATCAWCRGNPIGICAICQTKPSTPETYADNADAPAPRTSDAHACVDCGLTTSFYSQKMSGGFWLCPEGRGCREKRTNDAHPGIEAEPGLVAALLNAYRVAVAGEQAEIEDEPRVIMRRFDHPNEQATDNPLAADAVETALVAVAKAACGLRPILCFVTDKYPDHNEDCDCDRWDRLADALRALKKANGMRSDSPDGAPEPGTGG